MSNSKLSDQWERDAAAQITERGYPVREVSVLLGGSAYSPYAWKKKFAKASSREAEEHAEIRRLTKELPRVLEERDILKTVPSPPPTCARRKQPVLYCTERAVADALLAGWPR